MTRPCAEVALRPIMRQSIDTDMAPHPSGQPTIEKKGYAEPKAKRILMEALRGRGGKLTKADAMTVSGLPEAETRQALTVLLKEYRSHLSATESGELVYEFDPAFARAARSPSASAWPPWAPRCGRGFTSCSRCAIVVTLVVYFVLFVAMLIALVFARRSATGTTTAGSVSASPVCSGSGAGTWGDSAACPRGGDSRPSREEPFYKSVFDFVFGPPRAKVDPLADEEGILANDPAAQRAHRRSRSGAAHGLDFPRAEEEATRLLADYGGEPEVTDDGVVIYIFKELRKTTQSADDSRGSLGAVRPPGWPGGAAGHARRRCTGNEASTNTAMGCFNAFDLAARFSMVPMFEVEESAHLARRRVGVAMRDRPGDLLGDVRRGYRRPLGAREAGGARAREAERAR